MWGHRQTPNAVHKNEGYGTHYRYAHDEPQAYAAGQTYLPEAMTAAGVHFYQPNRHPHILCSVFHRHEKR